MCEWNNGGVAVDLPENMLHLKDSGRTQVCIDECIVLQIRVLWAHGIQTLGCCCGHGKQNPNIVVPASSNPTDTAEAYRILKDIDLRRWSILQWKLVEVATVPKKARHNE